MTVIWYKFQYSKGPSSPSWRHTRQSTLYYQYISSTLRSTLRNEDDSSSRQSASTLVKCLPILGCLTQAVTVWMYSIAELVSKCRVYWTTRNLSKQIKTDADALSFLNILDDFSEFLILFWYSVMHFHSPAATKCIDEMRWKIWYPKNIDFLHWGLVSCTTLSLEATQNGGAEIHGNMWCNGEPKIHIVFFIHSLYAIPWYNYVNYGWLLSFCGNFDTFTTAVVIFYLDHLEVWNIRHIWYCGIGHPKLRWRCF